MNKKQSLPWDHPRFRSWVSVARACQMMQSALARELAPLALKPPHLDILANLYRHAGLSQQELARKLLVGRSNISMTLPQMERRGLIERRSDSRDRRILRLFLTSEGEALALRAMQIQTALIDRSLSTTPLEDCSAIGTHMDRIIAALQLDDDGDTE